MADLTDAELDTMYGSTNDPRILMLVAEVRRWRDQAADEAGLARLAAEIGRLAESVDHLGRKGPGGLAGFGEMDAPPGWIMPSGRPQDGAHAPKEERSQ